MAQQMTATNRAIHAPWNWRAGLWAGLIAGLVFMMMEMGLVWMVQGDSPWAPPHMIAAMALGDDILPAPGTWAPFDMTVMLTAMMIHMLLSAALGVLGAALLRGATMGRALVLGALYGLAIYVLNFYVIAPFAFPWFVMAQNWISAFSHVMFGVVLGIVYVALRRTRAA